MVVTENEAPEQPLGEVLKQVVRVVLGEKLLPVTVTVVPTAPAFAEIEMVGRAEPPTANGAEEINVPLVPPNTTRTNSVPDAPAGTVIVVEMAPPALEVVVADVDPTPPEQNVLEELKQIV